MSEDNGGSGGAGAAPRADGQGPAERSGPSSGRARPVVLAATSGTGKTTLARRLVEGSDRYAFSISATTRPPRPGERDGIDYRFLSVDDFERRIAEGAFVEWARVHDRLYGTPMAEVEAAARRGVHVVLDIDVQGARQIRRALPDALLIFVLPPSVDIMMSRLKRRGTEEPAAIARRLVSALEELRAVPEFDHVVVNDDLDECVEEIRAIVEGTSPRETPALLRDGVRQEANRLLAEVAGTLEAEYGEYVQDNE